MFQLADGRQHVYQWDINVKLLLDESNESADEVHFSARFSRVSLSVEVVHTVDSSYVTIPNILLQKPNDIIAYSYITNADGSYTKYDTIIPVIARPKPSGYVYEETEILTWKTLDDKINDLGESTANSVKYTEQGLTDEQKAQARTNIGAVSLDEVPKQVQADMAQNDSTASDFVKNRTHYKEIVYKSLYETNEEFTNLDGDSAAYVKARSINLEAGKEYIVEYDGEKYSCVAKEMNYGRGLGNLYLQEYVSSKPECYNGVEEDTGEPFAIIDSQYYTPKLHCIVNSEGNHTIRVLASNEVIHRLSEEYLPESVIESVYDNLTFIEQRSSGNNKPNAMSSRRLLEYDGYKELLFVCKIAPDMSSSTPADSIYSKVCGYNEKETKSELRACPQLIIEAKLATEKGGNKKYYAKAWRPNSSYNGIYTALTTDERITIKTINTGDCFEAYSNMQIYGKK